MKRLFKHVGTSAIVLGYQPWPIVKAAGPKEGLKSILVLYGCCRSIYSAGDKQTSNKSVSGI
jgi:hypothetical protein